MAVGAQGLAELLAPYVGATWGNVIAWVLVAFILANFVMAVGGLISYVMRKVMARVQTRRGPNRVGPFGLLQFVADGIKMIAKEDVTPARADPWLHRLAPFFVILPIMVAWAPLPFSEGVILSDLRYGLLFLIAVGAASPLGEIIAGWASNNKYSMLGGLRAASMDLAYEIPMVISAVAVVLLVSALGMNGLSTMDIARAQGGFMWFVFLQPLGFFIFFVAALAKAGVGPVDLPEAESELVSGFHTEYSGMRFGVLQLGVFVSIVFVAALTALLYFGGWTLPFLTPALFAGALGATWGPVAYSLVGLLAFLAKMSVFTLLVLITWFTLPRIRPDQFLSLGWKVLFPLSLLNLVITVVEVRLITGHFGGVA